MTAAELLRRYAAGERDFSGADLRDADLRDADLTGALLRDADLTDTLLDGANLTGAVLRGADLAYTLLRGADLTAADLRGANLTDADLADTLLRGTNLRDADLTGVDLTGAMLSDSTIMPDGRVWSAYRADHLAGLCTTPEIRARAIEAWGGHQWTSCPMHAAHGVTGPSSLEMAAWVALYDAHLLKRPEVQS